MFTIITNVIAKDKHALEGNALSDRVAVAFSRPSHGYAGAGRGCSVVAPDSEGQPFQICSQGA